MINWRKIFSLRGLNYWMIGSALGWNLMAGFGMLILGFQVLKSPQGGIQVMQILLIVGAFLIAAMGGYVSGRVAGDGRGLAYGVYGSIGGAILFLYVFLSSGGVMGIIVAASAVFGGLNGGLFSGRGPKK